MYKRNAKCKFSGFRNTNSKDFVGSSYPSFFKEQKHRQLEGRHDGEAGLRPIGREILALIGYQRPRLSTVIKYWSTNSYCLLHV